MQAARSARTSPRPARGDRPSEGSSRISNRGSAIRPRPIASICCSPPLIRCRARCATRSRRRGKIAEHALEVAGAPLACSRERAQFEVLAHRQVREHAATLGHLDQAGLRRCRGSARRVRSAPSNCTVPPQAGVDTAHGVVQRRLAGAVAAQQRDDLAARSRTESTPRSTSTAP